MQSPGGGTRSDSATSSVGNALRGVPALPGGGTPSGDAAESEESDIVPQPNDSPAPIEPSATTVADRTPPVEPVALPGPLRVPIRQIDSNPFQPRQEFDEDDIQTLCDSLRAHGLLQPVVVRRAGQRYQLVAGERRLCAAVKASWIDVPVQVVEADDRQVAELAIVENLQRKDLSPLEKASSFQRYLEQYGCTQEELASRLKLDRSTIANLIRLLELPEGVRDALRKGKITQGHARTLLALGEEREQLEFCQRIQGEGLSVRQTEALVQDTIDRADAEPLAVVGRDGVTTKPKRGATEHVAHLEQEFRAALGMRVKLTHNARGRGKLTIHFSGHDEFDRVRRHICGGEAERKSKAG